MTASADGTGQAGAGGPVATAGPDPRAGESVAVSAEGPGVVGVRAALPAPDGQGVAVQFVDIVQRVALAGVRAGMDLGAGFASERPVAPDDLGERVLMPEEL